MDKKEAYKALAQEFIRENKIKRGTKVKILRVAGSNELGWSNQWTSSMLSAVGKEGTVVDDGQDSGSGISVSIAGMAMFTYPFFVLGVDKPKSIFVQVGSFKAEVKPENIEVGCQTITYEQFDNLVKAVQTVRERENNNGHEITA